MWSEYTKNVIEFFHEEMLRLSLVHRSSFFQFVWRPMTYLLQELTAHGAIQVAVYETSVCSSITTDIRTAPTIKIHKHKFWQSPCGNSDWPHRRKRSIAPTWKFQTHNCAFLTQCEISPRAKLSKTKRDRSRCRLPTEQFLLSQQQQQQQRHWRHPFRGEQVSLFATVNFPHTHTHTVHTTHASYRWTKSRRREKNEGRQVKLLS